MKKLRVLGLLVVVALLAMSLAVGCSNGSDSGLGGGVTGGDTGDTGGSGSDGDGSGSSGGGGGGGRPGSGGGVTTTPITPPIVTPCSCPVKDHLAIDETCGCGATAGLCSCTVQEYGVLPIGVAGANVPIYRAQGATDLEVTDGDLINDTTTNIMSAYGLLPLVEQTALEGLIEEIHIIPAAGGMGIFGEYLDVGGPGGQLIMTLEADLADSDIASLLSDVANGILLPTIAMDHVHSDIKLG